MPRPDASQKLAAAKPKDNGRLQLIIAVGLVLALVIGGFAAVIINSTGSKSDAVGPANSVAGGNGVTAYPGKAKTNAPQVQLYVDYQCPICNEFEKANGAQMMQLAKDGDIRLTVHVMSFLDNRLRNDSSKKAANASFCSADAGKFAEFHTELFKHQPEKEGDGYPASTYRTVAQQVGISGAALTTFDKCVSDNKYKDYVAATEEKSGKNGVTGTPTIIIDGHSSSDDSAMFRALTEQPNSFKSLVDKYGKKS